MATGAIGFGNGSSAAGGLDWTVGIFLYPYVTGISVARRPFCRRDLLIIYNFENVAVDDIQTLRTHTAFLSQTYKYY